MNYTTRAGEILPSGHAQALHKTLFIADLHADSLLWGRDLLVRGKTGQVDVPRLQEGNVALQVFSIVTKTPRGLNIQRNDARSDNVTLLALAQLWPPRTWSSLRERALYQATQLRRVVARSDGKFFLVRNASEFADFESKRRQNPLLVAGVLAIEGAHAIEGDLANLDKLFDAGVRIVAPTHFFDNDVAGSSSGVEKHGLTALGKAMVEKMEAKGMILDLAHASPATLSDALAVATRPVIVSHTGVRGTCDNARNLTDEEIQGVARTGGIIGIGYWRGAVCGGDVAAIARAIRYAANRAGIQHVALGSDFDGAVSVPFDTAGLVQLTDALIESGFNDDEIRLIMGGNVARVLRNGLPQQ